MPGNLGRTPLWSFPWTCQRPRSRLCVLVCHVGAEGGSLQGWGGARPALVEPASLTRPPFQGEKGEPGMVFSPDGRALTSAQKGAKVRGRLGPAGTLRPAWPGQRGLGAVETAQRGLSSERGSSCPCVGASAEGLWKLPQPGPLACPSVPLPPRWREGPGGPSEPAARISLGLAGPSFFSARQRSPHCRSRGLLGALAWASPVVPDWPSGGTAAGGRDPGPPSSGGGQAWLGLGMGSTGACALGPLPPSPGESWVWIRRLLGTGLQGVPKGPQDRRRIGRGTAGQRELCWPCRVSQLRSGPTDPSSPGTVGPTPWVSGPPGWAPGHKTPSRAFSLLLLPFLPGCCQCLGRRQGHPDGHGDPSGAGGRDLRPPHGTFWFSVQGEPGFRGPPVSRPRLPRGARARVWRAPSPTWLLGRRGSRASIPAAPLNAGAGVGRETAGQWASHGSPKTWPPQQGPYGRPGHKGEIGFPGRPVSPRVSCRVWMMGPEGSGLQSLRCPPPGEPLPERGSLQPRSRAAWAAEGWAPRGGPGWGREQLGQPSHCHPLCSAPGAPRDERTERGEGGAGRRQRGIQREGECSVGQAGVGGLAAVARVPELTCGRLLSSLVALGHADPVHTNTRVRAHAHTRAKAPGRCPGVVFSEGPVGRVGSGVGASARGALAPTAFTLQSLPPREPRVQ